MAALCCGISHQALCRGWSQTGCRGKSELSQPFLPFSSSSFLSSPPLAFSCVNSWHLSPESFTHPLNKQLPRSPRASAVHSWVARTSQTLLHTAQRHMTRAQQSSIAYYYYYYYLYIKKINKSPWQKNVWMLSFAAFKLFVNVQCIWKVLLYIFLAQLVTGLWLHLLFHWGSCWLR